MGGELAISNIGIERIGEIPGRLESFGKWVEEERRAGRELEVMQEGEEIIPRGLIRSC